MTGLGREGDGIDSNGFLVINGSTVIAMATPASDSGTGTDCGTNVNGGTIFADTAGRVPVETERP